MAKSGPDAGETARPTAEITTGEAALPMMSPRMSIVPKAAPVLSFPLMNYPRTVTAPIFPSAASAAPRMSERDDERAELAREVARKTAARILRRDGLFTKRAHLEQRRRGG